MDIKQIRDILEAPYNRKVWKSFIQTQFTNNNLLANDAPLNLGKSDLYTDCYSLGNYAIDDYTKIGIFEIQLADKVNLTRNRVALRNLIKSITQQVAGAMVVFVQGDKWRFSYISKRKIRNKETNTVEDKETAPKRYTYLFGKGEKALTASIRFDRLIQKQQGNLYQFLTLNDFEEAFSVEKLSKEFFAQYKEIYDDFVAFITGKRYIKKGSKWVETPTHEAHFQLRNYFNNDEKQARDFFKRMMGRIVFLYFIQKKGWLSCPMVNDKLLMVNWGQGDQDFMFTLYKNAKYRDSFYSEYLVPLFFSTLNNPDGKCDINDKQFINNYQLTNNNYFPYLNGGLFDKTQDYKYDKIALPASIFDKLFTTFNNYNFTIYEDAPDEHTVAVDPEMLGHIFENLLEDNKDKGAFYTPKDIVHYMCRESLHNYIFTYTGNEENEDFKTKLKLYNDTFDISIFEKDELKKIDRALEDVKICDPAIGSGAFPMGLLHEIYHLKIPIEDSKGMKAKSPADLKKHIIEESIYGVDIDSGAVDIARLRFWLSLVVDEVAPQPLPNLAFKIVCANTLIPLGKPKSDLSGSLEIAKAIEKLRHDYFDASKEDKKDLERQFKNLQNKLWATAKDWVSKEDGDIYLKISEFNPFEDKSCTWFDAWWMFGVKDGFDIVIGNPPYVQLQKLLNSKQYATCGYETYSKSSDLYCLFYEKGIKLLKPNGVLNFITSNSWMRTKYGFAMRKYFADNTNPIQLINFEDSQVFDTAIVESNILVTQKGRFKNYLKAVNVGNDIKDSISNYAINNNIIIKELDNNGWIVGSNLVLGLKKEIEKNTVQLGELNLQMYIGLLIGFNEAFVLDDDKRKELINLDNKNAEIIKPLLRGRDISKFSYNWANLWVILSHNGIKKLNIKRIDIENDYPIIYNHLLNYKEQLLIRHNKGDHWTNMRNCAYLEEFKKPKIIWGEISDKPKFSYDEKGIYANDRCSFFTGDNLKFLVSLLNSNLIEWYFNLISTSSGMGTNMWKHYKIKLIPIPKAIPKKKQELFETLVDYLLYLHNKETPQILTHTDNTRIASHFEDILNMMVYEIYFEDHMKKVGIDVLSIINGQVLIINEDKTQINNLPLTIKSFYEWYQKPDNAVRQRMLLVDTRSKDIIGLINKSL